ncbi:homeobox-leucine zipper protein ATHB-8-like [Senna tora]|uniref:Homeobox-leucine zipper protein ATHB-8-like n=1 Tax=Senna tora TaxID=362788 RepID=A0A834XBQ7_9FABA|nr:homeobox-leucine zipper protein ATHB-8-like [Senna tora]
MKGCLARCERALNNIPTRPTKPQSKLFVGTNMLFSGSLLMRLVEGGGPIIHIVGHKKLEYWSVFEVVHQLYESSTLFIHEFANNGGSIFESDSIDDVILIVHSSPSKRKGENIDYKVFLCQEDEFKQESVEPFIKDMQFGEFWVDYVFENGEIYCITRAISKDT